MGREIICRPCDVRGWTYEIQLSYEALVFIRDRNKDSDIHRNNNATTHMLLSVKLPQLSLRDEIFLKKREVAYFLEEDECNDLLFEVLHVSNAEIQNSSRAHMLMFNLH